MSETFLLEVFTPDKLFMSQPVRQVVFSSSSGRLGVMNGHMPMISNVMDDSLDIQMEDGNWREAAASEGFMEVLPEVVRFFLDAVEWADEIDVVRAREALVRASGRLQGKLSHLEYVRTHAAITRAMTRLKVAQK